jgi:hypothetical protein
MKITMEGKYKTRDGSAVRILCTDSGLPGRPVVALIRADGQLYLRTHPEDGTYLPGRPNKFDLIPDVQPHYRWINVYRAGAELLPGRLCESEDEADRQMEPGFSHRVRVCLDFD